MLNSLLRSLRTQPRTPPAGAEGPPPGRLTEAVVDGILTRIHTLEADNFDHARFAAQGVDSQQFLLGFARENLRTFIARSAEFEAAYELLADEASKAWMRDLIVFRVLGHLHMRLPTNSPEHWETRQRAENMRCGEASPAGSALGLHRYSVPGAGGPLLIDGWTANIAWSFLFRQYYFSRGGCSIAPGPGDRVVDAGSCFGDTALAFADSVGSNGRVFAFEIMPDNLAVARQNLERNAELAARVHLDDRALGERSGEDLYLHGSGPAAFVSSTPSSRPARVTTLDEFVFGGGTDRIDFIKMDIEGAELAALHGAQRTLRTYRPRLAISVYHRPEHLAVIPLWLHGLGLGYRFYLDHYTIHHEESILYAATG
jgi:FkbM family methyltransferase